MKDIKNEIQEKDKEKKKLELEAKIYEQKIYQY